MLEMFMVRVTLKGQLSASLSKFIWSNWSVWTKRLTNYKIWHGNKQQCKRGIKEISGQHKCYKDHCFAVVLYYTLLNHFTCNSNTLDAIIENGSKLNNTMQSKHCLTSVTLPDSVTIFGTKINVHFHEVSHRELRNLTKSRISFQTLILRKHTRKTGFLMWISSHCIACIYQKKYKSKAIVFSSDIWRQSFTSEWNRQYTFVVWII